MQDDGNRRGAAEDRVGHVPVILNDEIAKMTLAGIGPGDLCDWRDRMLLTVTGATVVKWMNLLGTIFKLARGEWRLPMRENPATADNAPRPANADVRRERCLEPLKASEVRKAAEAGEDAPLSEEQRLLAAIAGSSCPADLFMVRFAIA